MFIRTQIKAAVNEILREEQSYEYTLQKALAPLHGETMADDMAGGTHHAKACRPPVWNLDVDLDVDHPPLDAQAGCFRGSGRGYRITLPGGMPPQDHRDTILAG